MTQTADAPVRAWDLPTRLFKWLLVVLVGLAWVSHEYGDVTQRWHKINGYSILTLVTFRVLWGIFGSSTARFSHWIYGPGRVWRHITDMAGRRRSAWLGHTPLGGWMISALLVLLAAQATSGMFTADSNGVFGGPFAHTDFMSSPSRLQSALSAFHHNGFKILLGLIAVHVAVNLFHQFVLKDGLISAMMTGRKRAEPFEDEVQMQPAKALWLRAAACLAAAAVIVLGGVKLAGGSLL